MFYRRAYAIRDVICIAIIITLVIFAIPAEANYDNETTISQDLRLKYYDQATVDQQLDDGMVEVLIILNEQTDTVGIAQSAGNESVRSGRSALETKTDVRYAVVNALQNTAKSSQIPLIRYLDGEKNSGRVTKIESFLSLILFMLMLQKN